LKAKTDSHPGHFLPDGMFFVFIVKIFKSLKTGRARSTSRRIIATRIERRMPLACAESMQECVRAIRSSQRATKDWPRLKSLLIAESS
jgi:hypothetical protein